MAQKKALIVGAGAQGGPCASILARDEDISEIVLGDIDLNLANRVRDRIKGGKIRTVKVDASSVESIEAAAKGVDVIINLTLLQFDFNVIQAAVRSGAHYVDAAYSEPLKSEIMQGRPLSLNDQFKKLGLTALISCGGSPGVTNVMARYTADKLDSIDEIHVRLGAKPLEKPKEVVRAWQPTWSPEVALTDYAIEAAGFIDGKYTKHPPFSGCEEYSFPDPVGPVTVCHHAHDESVTLPHFIDKGIKNCTFKYPVDATAGSLVKMGFASKEAIDVRGAKVAPIHVLLKLVHAPIDTFFTEDEKTAGAPVTHLYFMLVEVKGTKSGENVMYKLAKPSATTEENLEYYRRFGTTKIGVALPAIVGAKMCMEGEASRGIIAPECLNPMRFMKRMADMGAPVKFMETSSRDVAIS